MSGACQPVGDAVTRAVASFDAALDAGRLAQAYLVVGAVLEQGTPFARAALGRLFCRAGKNPCGVCPACLQLEARHHPDAVWVEPEKKSRIIDIERIRDLQRLIGQTALAGGWKAVVLVGADRIGDAAANAFLKTLEEPPPRSLFLLLTDSPQAILPTILSRCQRLVLSTELGALAEPWRSRLLDILATSLGEGLAGRLARVTALGALLEDIRKHALEEEEARTDDEPDEDIFNARVEARYRGVRSGVIRAMMLWYRDLLVLVCGAGTERLCHEDRRADATRIAGGLRYRQAMENVRAVEGMQRQIDRNVNQDSAIFTAVNLMTA